MIYFIKINWTLIEIIDWLTFYIQRNYKNSFIYDF